MILTNLKIALRNLIKDKWFSVINVIGLTIGISCSLLLFLYISQELSFDQFHDDLDRIYRIGATKENSSGKDYDSSVPYPMINALHEDFNHFEAATLVHFDGSPLVQIGERKQLIDNSIFADSNFFDVFSFKVKSGNAKRDLGKPGYAFLSETCAKQLFGNVEPIGQSLRLRNMLDLEIAGIVEDSPINSHIQFDIIVSYPTFSTEYFNGLNITLWSMSANGSAYVKLKPEINAGQVEEHFKSIVPKYFDGEDIKNRFYYLQPLPTVHFDSQWSSNVVSTDALWALGIIGLFILLVGCINFINLSTARAIKRSKEVGVRKTLGAGRFQLLRQYLTDTLIVTVLSTILAVGLCERSIPLFNQHFDASISFNALLGYQVLLFLLVIVTLVTVLAGLYPAVILSSYDPARALKANMHSANSGSVMLRKGLIIFQFVISQVLIVATVVVSSQMEYFKNKELGFNKEALINVDLSENDKETIESLKTRLLANPDILNVSFSLASPLSGSAFNTHYELSEKEGDEEHQTSLMPVDYNYLDTYGLTLKYGSWFSESEENLSYGLLEKEKGDRPNISYIINEAAAKELGFYNVEEIVGQHITTGAGGISAPIIGVIKDYHLSSFHNEIGPIVFLHLPMFYFNTGIKINMDRSHEAISHIEQVFNQKFPNELFDYSFMDDDIARQYENERVTHNLFKVFSGISILISCLGLLGLISFMVAQKTKEVGIRKVLGAKVNSIVYLFSKGFVVLVLAAALFSIPLAYYVMDAWLADFAYRIDLQWWYFILAILLTGVITFLMVGFQSFKAAIANPVNALRDE